MRLLVLLLLLAGWVPSPPYDLTSLAFHADAVVMAKHVGDTTVHGRPAGRYEVVHSFAGPAYGTIVVDDAAYRIPGADPTRLLFLSRIAAADQAQWKLPEWVVMFDGARLVKDQQVYDFYAGDGRFEGGGRSGSFVDGGRTAMVPYVQHRGDPAFDTTKTGPLDAGELADAGKRAVARAAELRQLIGQPASAQKRARLLALLPPPRPAGTDAIRPHFPTELVDDLVLRELVAAGDVEGLLAALPRVAVLGYGWERTLQDAARDTARPEAQRVRALGALGLRLGADLALIGDPSPAIRAAVVANIQLDWCRSQLTRREMARQLRRETDPGVRAALERASKLKPCPYE